MATGLEKINFHFNPKERQCQRMFKLLYNQTPFTCQQGNSQNPSSKASTIHELRTSRCTRWMQKRQSNWRSNCQHLLDHREREFQKNTYLCLTDYAKAFDFYCGKFLKTWEYQTTLPASRETCMQLKQQQNRTWNNGLVQNWERSLSRLQIATLLI